MVEGCRRYSQQFSLEHHATFQIAKDVGINYPWERNTGYDTVLTTDFLITVIGTDGREQTLARTLKNMISFG